LYSAASEVNGTSSNFERDGLTGPEYLGFGTNVACPLALNAESLHGPSTVLQIGEVAYEVSCLDWASRYLYTAVQSVILVAQALGPETVRSHAAGIGVIWLRLLYRNQVCD